MPCDDERLERVIRLVPAQWRDDALQEAAVALLQGRSPTGAVDAFRKRLTRRMKRESPRSDLIERLIVEHDKDDE